MFNRDLSYVPSQEKVVKEILFCRLGEKESYMTFMNPFMNEQFANMRKFLDDISTVSNRSSRNDSLF